MSSNNSLSQGMTQLPSHNQEHCNQALCIPLHKCMPISPSSESTPIGCVGPAAFTTPSRGTGRAGLFTSIAIRLRAILRTPPSVVPGGTMSASRIFNCRHTATITPLHGSLLPLPHPFGEVIGDTTTRPLSLGWAAGQPPAPVGEWTLWRHRCCKCELPCRCSTLTPQNFIFPTTGPRPVAPTQRASHMLCEVGSLCPRKDDTNEVIIGM